MGFSGVRVQVEDSVSQENPYLWAMGTGCWWSFKLRSKRHQSSSMQDFLCHLSPLPPLPLSNWPPEARERTTNPKICCAGIEGTPAIFHLFFHLFNTTTETGGNHHLTLKMSICLFRGFVIPLATTTSTILLPLATTASTTHCHLSLATTTIATHQPTSKTSANARFQPPPPPPPSSKTSHGCSFSRVDAPWQHHLDNSTSWKQATYACFQGQFLLGSSLLQPTTTTTLHPQKRACMLVFNSIVNFFKY